MKKEIYAIILAAGSGSRMQTETKKQFLLYQNKPLWWQSFITFYHSPFIHGIILVFPEEEQCYAKAVAQAEALLKEHNHTLPVFFCKGGALRQDSVYNALSITPPTATHVLVHDSARPFFTAFLITKLVEELNGGMKAVAPSLPLSDTIKEFAVTKEYKKFVTNTPNRNFLRAVQTPQAFSFTELLQAHRHIREKQLTITDDAMAMEELGIPVLLIDGESSNHKITHKEDLSMLTKQSFYPCCGYGYDVHKFQGNRPFVLGGVTFDTDMKIEAHSDGDVLIHALMDALLSCMAEGDIGKHFPDSSKEFENISSLILLDKVMEKWKQSKLQLSHVDLTVICQKPKISPYTVQIKKNICRLLSLSENQVNIKATTEEGLGFTGNSQGIKAVALVSAVKIG